MLFLFGARNCTFLHYALKASAFFLFSAVIAEFKKKLKKRPSILPLPSDTFISALEHVHALFVNLMILSAQVFQYSNLNNFIILGQDSTRSSRTTRSSRVFQFLLEQLEHLECSSYYQVNQNFLLVLVSTRSTRTFQLFY